MDVLQETVEARPALQQLKEAGKIDDEQAEMIVLATDLLDDLSDSEVASVQPYMLDFLDQLKESGEVNMFAAAPVVAREYELLLEQARVVVLYWMRTYSERHACPTGTRFA